jgi:multicomponent Na+:H+ antiporter subunit E
VTTDSRTDPDTDAVAGNAMHYLFVVLKRALLFAALWLLLTHGHGPSWIIGIPFVLLATIISMRITPQARSRWSLAGVLRFIPFFVRESVRGGIDVSRRIVQPAMPLQPALIQFTTRLPAGSPRLFLLNVVNLLPGTLSADVHDHHLTLHVLDKSAPTEQELRRLEEHIHRIFGLNQEQEQ